MKNFNFCAPTKILFGKNKVNELGSEILVHGSRVLFLYGGGSIKKIGLYDQVISILNNNQISFVELGGVKPNPRLDSVREGIRMCRKNQLDFILAVGGGSVIDCAKAIAAGVTYNGDVWDFMIHNAKVDNPLPVGTILTLAATGSEMNGNAVISNIDESDKRAMSDDSLRPRFSILDPTLTFSVNAYYTAAGTVDIISHIFEQYFTLDMGTYLQDAIAEAILKTCIHYGPIVQKEPENYEARANLMWASSLALNGLTVTGKLMGDWTTHNLEHQLSAVNDLTHGAGLAILFPFWMEYILDERTVQKLAKMARNVLSINSPDDMVAAKEGIKAVRHFFNSLGMPQNLSEVGFKAEHIDGMAEKVCKFGPVGMFKRLGLSDVQAIYQMAM